MASFCLFTFFSHDKYSSNTINDKSVDGVLGTQARGGRMVSANESTELWQHPIIIRIICRCLFVPKLLGMWAPIDLSLIVDIK